MREIPKILVIDDDMVDRLVIARALRKAGMKVEVTEASNIETGMRYIAEEEWDCVFLDYLLPGGDGLDLLKEIRRRGHDVPIVVVTSQGDEKVAVEVMKAGGTDYVTKDLLSSDSVATVLRNALRAYRAEAERRETSKALADSEARLAEAQRIANIGSWEVDLATRDEFWTEQVYVIIGEPVQKNAKMGRNALLQYFLPKDIERCRRAFSDIMELQQPLSIDAQILTRDGRIRDVELQGKPVLGADGRLVKVIGTIQDISARKEIEQAMLEAKELAEQNARAKQEFLANMSHEIRTPMNAILGFAKLLKDTPLDERQQEYLLAIDTSGEALLAVLNDILDLSKIEAGMMRFEHHAFSVKESLRSVQNILGPRAKEKGLALDFFIGPGVPEQVLGDSTRLRQVLLNLVTNAIKFTEVGEVSVEVKLMREEGRSVRLLFEVADTGIGVAEDKQTSIFDSFTQASSDTTRKYGGTGLGLTICKLIVELQGGRIGLESELGEGSVFFFELDFQLPDEQHGQAVAFSGAPASTGALPPLRILLAEDNLLNQRLATFVLEKMGLEVILANTGQEAVDLVSRERPDLVLMDVQMPGMDGYAATALIRQLDDPELRTIPIVALTAHALREEMEKGFAAGMDAFVTKPFQADHLRTQIMSLVQERRPLSVAPPVAEAPAGLDLRTLHDVVGGDQELREELIAIFVREVPLAMARMQEALDTDDPQALYRAAHTVKPSLILFGLPGVEPLVRTLEDAGKIAHVGQQERQAYAMLRSRVKEAVASLSQAPDIQNL